MILDVKSKPDEGMGFIYIISNPAFPDLYKVGLTAQNIKDRLKDLNSTGVPDKYKIENLFEVPQKDLLRIESLCHQKLKKLNLHYNKEFFKNLTKCKEVVIDTIVDVTKNIPADFIDEYNQRKIILEKEKLEQQKIRSEVDRLNGISEGLRQNYLRNRGVEDGYIIPFFMYSIILFMFLIIVGIESGTLLFLSLCVFSFLFFLSKSKNKEKIIKMSREEYPLLNMNDIETNSENYKRLNTIIYNESVLRNQDNNT